MADFPLTPDEFKKVYSLVSRLCVEVIIKTASGIVLSLRSIEPWKGEWHIPGGSVWYGETVEAAVKRVAKTEVGVDVAIEKLLGYIEYPSEVAKRGFGSSIGLAFLVSMTGGELHGSEQGETVEVFTAIPPQTIIEQAQFLRLHHDQLFENPAK